MHKTPLLISEYPPSTNGLQKEFPKGGNKEQKHKTLAPKLLTLKDLTITKPES